MIALLLSLAAAHADPAALRAPVPGLVLGAQDSSAAAPVGPVWGVVEAGTTGAHLGLSVGDRWVLSRGARSWGVDASLAGGALVPTLDPGLALTATPALTAGWFGDGGTWTVGLAAPLVAGWSDAWTARLPVLAETATGLRIGPVWAGARLATGPVWTPGLDVAVRIEPSLWIALAP